MVAVFWIEGGSKTNNEEISSSIVVQFGGGALKISGMVSNLVLNSTEIKMSYSLLVHKTSLSEALAKQFRTSCDDYREKTAIRSALRWNTQARCKG